jgi:hypothetical protein
MALTKDERRALELAREKIAIGKSHALCLALWSVGKECEELIAAVERLTKYIQRALFPSCILTTWQAATLGQARWGSERADRLAWIDWMLGKPLPGEQVVLAWDEKLGGTSETEYCGRFFSIMPRQDGFSVIEIEDPDKALGRRICRISAGIQRDQIDAAIVAHVWPEA